MKTFMQVISFMPLTPTLFCQVQSSCQRDWALSHYYENCVSDLVINRLYKIKSPDSMQVIIPQIHKDSIWRGLAAIYNAFSIPERDSVFDVFCVHFLNAWGSVIHPAVSLFVDTTLAWTDNWRNGILHTGYAELDHFIDHYQYDIHQILHDGAEVVLNSPLKINPWAVSDTMKVFNGIKEAYPEPEIKIYNRLIKYDRTENFQYFDFSIVWNDCINGCTYQHTWKFKVNEINCEVEFLGLVADPTTSEYPKPSNCNITAISTQSKTDTTPLKIYPNPAYEDVTLECEDITLVELWNDFQLIHQWNVEKQDQVKIDVSTLTPGIYFVKVMSATYSKTAILLII